MEQPVVMANPANCVFPALGRLEQAIRDSGYSL
jgi:hypothetical protein